jgi:hypothetical protein
MGRKQELIWPDSEQPLNEDLFWNKFNSDDVMEEQIMFVDMTAAKFVDAVVWARQRWGREGPNWFCTPGLSGTSGWYFVDDHDRAEFLLIWH